jgi:hypothetical protein
MAMSFQKIVLIIAIVLLIITLVFIGMALNKAKSQEQWPPMIADCPDYWVDLSGNGSECVNTHSLGTCNIPTKGGQNAMDFTASTFTGSNEMCAKYTWAKGCGVTWDGITSGVPNPCSSS